MNDQDVKEGLWVSNIPYIYVDGERLYKYPDDRKDINDLIKKGQGCNKKLFNKLTQNREFLVVKYKYKKDGRYCYDIKEFSSQVLITPLPKYLDPVACYFKKIIDPNKYYNLSYLICSQLKGSSFKSIFNLSSECTKFGSKIATSLIKIASTRIFSVPEQSIIELLVNSLDSYSYLSGDNNRIGKFGMGFFSFLYWLIKHPNRTLHIYSCYSNDLIREKKFNLPLNFLEGEKSEELGNSSDVRSSHMRTSELSNYQTPQDYTAYHCAIRFIDNELKFSLKILDSNCVKTGTRIYLEYQDNTLNSDKFLFQTYKLEFIKSFPIYNTSFGRIINSNYNKRNKNKTINYSSSRYNLFVEDYATGIPLEILLTSLFVPSISTKTIELSEQKSNYQPSSRIEDHGLICSLHILVGEISIVNLKLVDNNDSFILDMPPNTPLPVSRDDILITDKNKSMFLSQLDVLLEQSVKRNMFYLFEQLLEKYINYTANLDTQVLIRTFLSQAYDKLSRETVLIDIKYSSLYQKLNLKSFIFAKKVDMSKVEDYFDKHISPDLNIFYGRKVFIYQDYPGYKEISNGGTLSYLFIPQSIVNNNKKWIDLVSSIYTLEKIYPVQETKFSLPNKEWDIALTQHLGYEKYKKELYIFYTRLLSLQYYYNITDKALDGFFKTFKEAYNEYYELDSEFIPKYITSYLNFFSQLIPKQVAYGAGKSSISYPTGYYKTPPLKEQLEFLNKLIKDDRLIKKLKTLYKEWTVVYLTIPRTSYNQMIYIAGKEQTNLIFDLFLWYEEREQIAPQEQLSKLVSALKFSINKSKNIFEFIYLNKMLMYASTRHVPNEYLEIYFNKAYSIMLEHYYQIDQSYIYRRVSSNIHIIIQDKALGLAESELLAFSNFISSTSNYKKETLILPSSQYKFKLSSLINYLLVNEFTGDINSLFKTLSEIEVPSTDLQLTDIAINFGTTKAFLDSILTELVQNSLDAIRSRKEIDITTKDEIYINSSIVDNKYIKVSITDFIGMNNEAIIALSVPFLSTKVASDITTGEMGSGFFNIYRGSEIVTVQTIYEGRTVEFTDTPIYSSGENKRIIDINRKVNIQRYSVQKDTNFENSTTISFYITFNKPNNGEIEVLTYVDYFVTKIIALMEFTNIQYNGNKLQKPDKTLIYQNYDIEAYLLPQGYSSYIYTKGVPFYSFKEFFIDKEIIYKSFVNEMESNIMINIKQNLYTPVQSRSNLIITSENLIKLRKYLYDIFFYFIIYSINLNRHLPNSDNYYFGNISSAASIEQVVPQGAFLPDVVDNTRQFAYLYPFIESQSTSLILKEIYKGIYLDTINGKPNLYHLLTIEDWKKHIYSYLSLKNIVIPDSVLTTIAEWFRVKDYSKKKESIEEILKRLNKELDKPVPSRVKFANEDKFIKILSSYIKIYWDIIKPLKLKGSFFTSPTIIIDKDIPGNLGFFMTGINQITLNSMYLSDIVINKFLEAFNSKNTTSINSTDFYRKYLDFSIPATTLIHELTHAWNRVDEGYHDDIELNNVKYSFDDASNEIRRYVIENGLLDKWYKEN